MQSHSVPESRFWARSVEEVLAEQDVEAGVGLSQSGVATRRIRFGSNALTVHRPRSAFSILIEQFASILVLLLALGAALSFTFGDIPEGIAILIVLAVNAAIGFAMEYRATRSMEALKSLGRATATVRRNGVLGRVSADELVPGDMLVLEAGDMVAADARVIEASGLQLDESALTGESLPVDKAEEPVDPAAPLAERGSMLYRGTSVVKGASEAVVVATGMATEIGRITSLVDHSEAESTPLERRLDRLGRKLVWITLGIAILIALAGLGSGRDWVEVAQLAIALAVATVPEGLPIVATIALARGMWRMARQHALIRRLSAVETLGSTTVILTDKTGTLTENRMTVEKVITREGDFVPTVPGSGLSSLTMSVLEAAVLCSSAESGQAADEFIGDPMEVAILRAGERSGLLAAGIRTNHPEIEQIAFDSTTRRMASLHRVGDGVLVAVKGAPEALLPLCEREIGGAVAWDVEARQAWATMNEELSQQGYRVIGVAEKRCASVPEKPFDDLVWLGLLAFQDPPRAEVRAAIEACRSAGIRTVMVTGDQAGTAQGVAERLGLAEGADGAIEGVALGEKDSWDDARREELLSASVFARVSPAQKLHLIELHQSAGEVVAMIGDGVNDAPALKKADIGVAMGQRGTDVAREASDMVLQDDAFATIVHAIQQGRVIFRNIRRFVLYLLSCNVSEIFVVGIAAAANAPLPILPLQILFLNLVTDVFPALALGAGDAGSEILDRPPRRSTESILEGHHWAFIFSFGGILTFAVLGSMAIALRVLQLSPAQATTVSFLTLALGQLWHVFNLKDAGQPVFRNSVMSSPWIHGALALCLLLTVGAVYLPGISSVMSLSPPGVGGWLTAVGMSLVPLVVGQIWLSRKRS